MIRVALTAVLLAAVAGVAFQAIETARRERTATRLDAAAERLARTAALLVDRDDPTARSVAGARRVVSVRLPAPTLTDAPVTAFGVDGERDVVDYRISGGPRRRVRVPVDLETPDGRLVRSGSGRYRFTLELVGGRQPTVVVDATRRSRTDRAETERGLKSGDATTTAHVAG